MKLCIFSFLCWSLYIYAFPQDSESGSSSTKCYEYNSTNSCNNGTFSSDCETIKDCGSSHCYALWANNTETGFLYVKFKGCFTISKSHCPGDDRCVDIDDQKKGLLFCCCKESYCNKNVFWEPTPAPPTTTLSTPQESGDNAMYLIYVIFPLFMVLFLVIMYILRKKKFSYFGHLSLFDCRSDSPSAPTFKELESLELIDIKARGKFGAVWKGRLNNEIVAVKIMPIQEKQSWLTEQEVYSLPLITHDNILRFIGAEKHGDSLLAEYYLVTAYHELGSLYDFLKVCTISWEQLCHITYTMAKGLAHLHGEIISEKQDSYKPAVAHRDFKSSNVLLKSDLTACIADFGLALIFNPSKRQDTHGQTMVGTRRYMAPEVLEGAIQFFRDSYLRIDMYAFALVLWELASRCSLQQTHVPDYKLPFEEEIGLHPTLEDIQEAVVHKKQRPLIKNNWREHPGLALLCDTIEECWDHDADARLTASCILERMTKISEPHFLPLFK